MVIVTCPSQAISLFWWYRRIRNNHRMLFKNCKGPSPFYSKHQHNSSGFSGPTFKDPCPLVTKHQQPLPTRILFHTLRDSLLWSCCLFSKRISWLYQLRGREGSKPHLVSLSGAAGQHPGSVVPFADITFIPGTYGFLVGKRQQFFSDCQRGSCFQKPLDKLILNLVGA